MTTPRDATPIARQARRSRGDVVTAAMRLLDEGGLAGMSMRTLAHALDVQASALYWHFPNKQSILAAVADRIVARARITPESTIDEVARELRSALLATSDGAEVVASTLALGLGEQSPVDALAAALPAGAPPAIATTLAHYLLGHTQHWQQRRFAERLGLCEPSPVDELAEFQAGLAVILGGLVIAGERSSAGPPPQSPPRGRGTAAR